MKRSGPLVRKTRLKRRGPRYARYHARTLEAKQERRAATFERVYGGEARLAWLHRQPCVVSGERPVEAAHVVSGGMARKADADRLVPLTPALHRELHAIGRSSFEWKFGVNLREKAAMIDKRWQRERGA